MLHFIFLLYCLRKMVQHQVKNFLSSLLVTIFLCFYAESLLTANKSIKCFLKNGCILYFVVILEKWKLTPPPRFTSFCCLRCFKTSMLLYITISFSIWRLVNWLTWSHSMCLLDLDKFITKRYSSWNLDISISIEQTRF